MQLGSRLSSRLPKGSFVTLVTGVALTVLTALIAGQAAAQSPFSPAIRVNEGTISYYELDQRARFLLLLRAPGIPEEEARKALIEERLKDQAVRSAGIEATEEEIATGISEFAARANLTGEEFTEALTQAGVDPVTFRD
ncbi:MAG: SurA N-terminal domain-containing protein, partial [Proteobacteria bacterium]|nr:SurA N-terminal domain-containing protein [Pseudomonadota bacterium]